MHVQGRAAAGRGRVPAAQLKIPGIMPNVVIRGPILLEGRFNLAGGKSGRLETDGGHFGGGCLGSRLG